MKLNSKRLLWAGLIAGLSVLFFLPVIQSEFLSWDDQALYIDNPYYTGLIPGCWTWMCTTFRYGHWQPLTWLSCALDYKLWGLNPQGWHMTSLLLHAMNVVLVYLLCLEFLKRTARKSLADRKNYCAVALASGFWAFHPLRVEAVSWLSTRGYLLCALFCLLTVLFYIRSAPKYSLAALLCFALATFSKGIGMMLPLVLLLIDWVPLRRITSIRTAFCCAVEKAPFFVLSLVTGVTAFLAKRVDGGMAPVEVYGLGQRVGQALYGIWFYLCKTVSPQHLSPLYEKRPELYQVLAVLLFLTGTAVFLFLFRRRLRPIIGTFGAFFLLIFPMLGITQSGSQIFADRFTYLAAVPLSVLLAAGLSLLKSMRRTVFGALAVLLLIFGVQSFIYSAIWRNGLSLWAHAISVKESRAGAQNNMGIVFIQSGFYGEALACFDKALVLRPDYADALNNRALIRVRRGEYEKAVRDLAAALAQGLMRTNDRANMRITHGLALEELGQDDAALAEYSAVIASQGVDPSRRLKALQARARLNLAAGQVNAAKADLVSMLTLPDLSGKFHDKARYVLDALAQ